jgi:hypothetical protein
MNNASSLCLDNVLVCGIFRYWERNKLEKGPGKMLQYDGLGGELSEFL